MDTSEDISYTCENCQSEVNETDDFCPNCGALFLNTVYCKNHGMTKAENVCVICCEPYCERCAEWVDGVFLCAEHSDYEIREGMACVYMASDDVHVNYIAAQLKEKNLHPFIFKSRHRPLSIDHSLFKGFADDQIYNMNATKIMIPFQEVLEAEKILNDLDDR